MVYQIIDYIIRFESITNFILLFIIIAMVIKDIKTNIDDLVLDLVTISCSVKIYLSEYIFENDDDVYYEYDVINLIVKLEE